MSGDSPAISRLRGALAAAPPSVVAKALATRSTSFPDPQVPAPAPGQCWLLRWDDLVSLAVVTRVREHYLLVMPVDLDPDIADETAVVVPAAAAGFADDVPVFALLETGVGEWVLDCYVCDLLPADDVAVLRSWMRTGETSQLPTGWREGTPTHHAAHPRHLARLEVAERIGGLGEADWLEPTWSRHAKATGTRAATAKPQAVHAALGGTAQRALALANGLDRPTADERVRLERAGVHLPDAGQPTLEVIAELDSAAMKTAIVALASRRSTDEGQVRRSLAEDSMAMAARRSAAVTTGLSNEVLIVRDLLRRELEEAAP